MVLRLLSGAKAASEAQRASQYQRVRRRLVAWVVPGRFERQSSLRRETPLRARPNAPAPGVAEREAGVRRQHAPPAGESKPVAELGIEPAELRLEVVPAPVEPARVRPRPELSGAAAGVSPGGAEP